MSKNLLYSIQEIRLQGFRAYLVPCTFKLSQQKSIAIFAPNGNGKSSLIDGLEFLFSDTGTLDRLGQRAVHNSAGPTALVHNLAAEHNVVPQVSVVFRLGNVDQTAIRDAADQRQNRPAEATAVKSKFAVDPIIRGYSLRRFVEEQKAEERYAEVARWLQLSPFVQVQRNLRALRAQIKAACDDLSPITALDKEISTLTGQAVVRWDDEEVLTYINDKILGPLDAKLKLVKLEETDPSFTTVKVRAAAEDDRVGLGTLRQCRDAVAALYAEEKNDDAEEAQEAKRTGAIVTFIEAIDRRAKAEQREGDERGKASAAVFASVWEAAEPLFAEGKPDLEACPVCETPVENSPTGTVAGIRERIAAHQAELAEYSAAKRELDAARAAFDQTRQRLIARLEALPEAALEKYPTLRDTSTAFLAELRSDPKECPDIAAIIKETLEAHASLEQLIKEIEEGQGELTYAKALAIATQALDILERLSLANETRAELTKLHEALNDQAGFVSGEIRTALQSLLDSLRKPVNEIYAAIQGPAAILVRLELPPEEDTNQQRLNLLVDFAPNREGVQPSGFLSDSQIHTLALALRLAAIEQFNVGAPFIVLDDIVTSYDADHRRRISALLAERFGDVQTIITTHDERFFSFLKDQLPQKHWQFKRVVGFDREYGPRFADHRVTDVLLEEKWAKNESAANEMRQAEEEWLLTKCREFGCRVVIRSPERAHSYERSELAEALAKFLKDTGLVPDPIAGVANRFLDSLQRGAVENFGSHFQDAQYGNGSTGDEKARWEEFTAFRGQFKCPRCGGARFMRPHVLKLPLCAKDNCQTPFAFAANKDAAADGADAGP